MEENRKYFFAICNVCHAEKRTKRNSNILLRLVRFSAWQTLLDLIHLLEQKIFLDSNLKVKQMYESDVLKKLYEYLYV